MDANNRAMRRLHQLARHVGSIPEDRAWLRVSLCGLACSGAGGREAFQRRDNRTLFARQSSDGHGQFMRQALAKQVVGGDGREDARLTSVAAPRPAADGPSSSPGKTARVASDDGPGPTFAAVEPLFARPSLDADVIEKQVTDVAGQGTEPEIPSICQESGSCSQRRNNGERAGSAQHSPSDAETAKKASTAANDQARTDCFGFEWFPRMDVVESGTACVITVELPGVSADGIHVEVVRSSLIVTGSRATDWWKANSNGSNGGGTVYHRRELAQGPYRAVWRLPKNSDINGITAEFIEGFLRVLVPKIKTMTYL